MLMSPCLALISLNLASSLAFLFVQGLVVYESLLAWGTSYICLGSSVIFFIITAKSSRHSGLQAVSSIIALSLLIASVVATLLAI